MGGLIARGKLTDKPVEVQPWRRLDDEIKGRQYFIKEAKTKIRDSRINILVTGHAGSGKSSFINSIYFISRGQIANVCPVKNETEESEEKTQKIQRIPTLTDDLFRSVHFYDTMGFTCAVKNEGQGISEDDLRRVCNGEIEDKTQSITDSATKATSEMNRPHCVIFVVSAEVLLDLDGLLLKRMKAKLERLNSCVPNDIAKIAVITKCDMVCKNTAKDFAYVFKSRIVEGLVKRAAKTFVIQENNVFPIVNFTKDVEVTTKSSVPILSALRYVLDFPKDRADTTVGKY